MSNIAVYPGTFDPITNGHTDLVNRGCRLFDKIIILVAEKTQKNTLFTIDERIKFVESVFSDNKKIIVEPLNELVVDYATKKSAKIILRGLRAISDFEYEVQLASMNRSMQPDIESVFMSPSDEYSFLSSSIVKDIARHGGDLRKFVHPSVLSELIKKFN
tara:strand:- start:154 stop:633 length:480 start_codon:yes stop_codon:yes gene_type:complete